MKQGNGRVNALVVVVLIAILSITTTPLLLQSPSSEHQHESIIDTTTDDCEKRLDAMDSVFEYQRDVRRSVFGKRYPPTTKPQVFFDPYEPEAVCLTEERFGGGAVRYGSLGDGPKFVCGIDVIDPKDCLVYNVGSNNQIDFEQAVSQEIGCEIHTFDPTLVKPYIGYYYSHFHPWGLGVENKTINMFKGKLVFQAKSIPQIVKELGHTERKIDILKIDCEGCEYTVMPVLFQAIQNGTMQVIHQIEIELHAFGKLRQVGYEQLQKLFGAADDAGYRIFHKERNHWGCNGYTCVEYSLVHKSFLRRANAAVVCLP